ncbi:hypothetical protein P692DRAFT_20385800 [Suillus brevipes Sb2]|nr:hypothetical protein P692DRAFT_20385800 [Suillus brevipes Sb2]
MFRAPCWGDRCCGVLGRLGNTFDVLLSGKVTSLSFAGATKEPFLCFLSPPICQNNIGILPTITFSGHKVYFEVEQYRVRVTPHKSCTSSSLSYVAALATCMSVTACSP